MSIAPDLPPRRLIADPDTPVPPVQLLSNGRYHVMLSATGACFSRTGVHWCSGADDGVCDSQSSFCYLRDRDSGALCRPRSSRCCVAEHDEADFSDGRARFMRSDDGIDVRTKVAVAGADDVEVRRVHITNQLGRASTARRTPA